MLPMVMLLVSEVTCDTAIVIMCLSLSTASLLVTSGLLFQSFIASLMNN